MSVWMSVSAAGLGTLVTCSMFGLMTISPGAGMSAAWAGTVDSAITAATPATTRNRPDRPFLRGVNTREPPCHMRHKGHIND